MWPALCSVMRSKSDLSDDLLGPTNPIAAGRSDAEHDCTDLPWIARAEGAPHFATSLGEAWTPLGQNGSIAGKEFAGRFRRRDRPSVEHHLRHLKDHGVTCLRLILEYAQGQHGFLDRPVGCFVPAMARLWEICSCCAARSGCVYS